MVNGIFIYKIRFQDVYNLTTDVEFCKQFHISWLSYNTIYSKLVLIKYIFYLDLQERSEIFSKAIFAEVILRITTTSRIDDISIKSCISKRTLERYYTLFRDYLF